MTSSACQLDVLLRRAYDRPRGVFAPHCMNIRDLAKWLVPLGIFYEKKNRCDGISHHIVSSIQYDEFS